ncbi:DNA internalization-related competence protein ComEC/Rec2 [Ornithinibacillus sp. L9]|uniref:DNA internalization-related competence protein ComEC/Rec2 n=1 Tax=Ornithinibacillus caprae TaxID=2678566 RepID=A0A6N8FG94_9BACI|nr:DNA internalization-related competence protein ComEC/Rec2 [Ornithinibacillus caprae]MUK87067.1 DNA internalization-related competence protein ComEC/Rec2 [Ornithinibacillus caprae]
MKGKWYIVALCISISLVAVQFHMLFFIGIFIWLLYLYYVRRLGKLPILISLTFSLFFIFFIPQIDHTPPEIIPTTIEKKGKINSSVLHSDNYMSFTIQEISTRETIQIVYFPNHAIPTLRLYDINHGATCTIQGTLQLPKRNTNPGEFNYRNYLAKQGITYQMVIESLDDLDCEGSSFLVSKVLKWKEDLKGHLKRVYSRDTYAWISALVLGSDEDLSDETIHMFQRWSLSHLLAISGLHIGLIVAFIYFFLIQCNIVTKEKAQWIMLCFLPLYALLAGGEPSVLRASSMVLLVLLLSKFKLATNPTDILSMVFIILMLFDKYIVYQIGFQLSFIVTIGIILSRKWLSESNSMFFQVLSISFVSQLMIIPLQFVYFYNVQPLSVLLNVIVVPYFSLIVIPLMFILVFFSLLPMIRDVFDNLFVLMHDRAFIPILEWIDEYMYFPWITGDFPVILAVVYYGILMLVMKYIQEKKLLYAFQSGVAITVLLILVLLKPYVSPYGSITMLDIGQGDAFVIELPYREGVILIDAGANFMFDETEAGEKIYTQIIKPFLHSKGIVKLDAIFLTHEDIDHTGSVPYIIDEFKVKNIIISEYFHLNSELMNEWKNHNVKISKVRSNEEIVIGDHSFYIMSPLKNMNSTNENSLVILSEFGNLNWLFTGDIGIETEREIISSFPELTIDVLKIAHHGSNTSTARDFVEHINASFGLISVGRNNLYGHPKQEVIQTLEEAGVTILRTDQDGAVFFHFNHVRGTFYKYVPYDTSR